LADELIDAVNSGKLSAIRAALRAKPKPGVLARAAVMCGGRALQPALELLYKHGVDLNGVWRGYRPLHNLIQERPHGETKPTPERLDCMQWLLEHGADPELPAAWPPARTIVVAAFGGEPAFVKILREAGAKVEGFAGAALGDRKLVEKTIKKDPGFVNGRDAGSLTALQCACGGRMPRGEYAAIARMLVDAGADPHLRTNSWNHQLDASYYAAGAKDPALLELLLESGADPQEALGHTVWGKHFEHADIAIRHGAKPDRAIHDGKPLLNDLIRWGQITQAMWLLDRGASPNVADAQGWTAVHQAASRGNVRMLAAVLEAGGDRNCRDKLGHTPADVAQIMKRTKLIPLLTAAAK
jgi:ankyrin repeat protein